MTSVILVHSWLRNALTFIVYICVKKFEKTFS
jgi:hypothetical protein